jgi:oligo-1,6-glucosidase
MQWSAGAHAGFTSGEPWLKENPNYREINVQEQQGREDSVLWYYKKLIALRKDPAYKETIVYGGFEPVPDCGHNVIAYFRTGEDQTILVAANFNLEEREIALPGALDGAFCETLLVNDGKVTADGGVLRLQGLQAAVILLRK